MKSFSDLGNYVSSELVANLAILVCTNPRWRLPSGIWIPNRRVATGVSGWELKKLELIRWSIFQAFVERDAAIRWKIEDKWSQALKHVSWSLRCISRFCGSQRNMICWLRSDYTILGLACDWIGCQTRSVLANPILWYKVYLGGLGSTLGGTWVLISWVAVLQRLLARALRTSRVVSG